MYEFTSLDRPHVDPGTRLLLVGADAGRTRDRLLDALAEGEDEAVLLVGTADADGCVDGLRRRGRAADAIGVVDASGATEPPAGVAESDCVAGPGALSAIGIAASDHLDRLGHRFDRVRVGLHSTSDLLDAGELAAVFRFLHVFGGRVRGADATLVATFDGSAQEEAARRTLGELFDETIEVE